MSGLRQGVEVSDTDNTPSHASRPSTPLSSSQLAETALTNLRKSLASQRSQTGSPVPKTPASKKKLSLEDRLRASLTTADASNASKSPGSGSTPPSEASPSIRSDSPASSISVQPLSPNLIPLPDSPALPPVLEHPHVDDLPGTSEHNERDGLPQEPTQVDTKEGKVDSPSDVTTISPGKNDQISSSSNAHQEPPTDVELLRDRLKQVEQRFLDVSESFKKLQADRAAADVVLRELTPLQSVQDTIALSDYLKDISSKSSLNQNGIKELEAKVQKQEQLIQEMSEKHRSESRSQSDVIGRLKSQVNETEALFKASLDASSHAYDSVEKQKLEFQKLQAETERAKTTAKEEEEKRVKAISLLKTVRQKLVKTEKEREDALKEVVSLKGREQEDRDRDQADKVRLQEELNASRTEKEKAVSRLKAQFEKEMSVLKERYDKEMSALRGQSELESVTLKATQTKELSQKASQVAALETSLNNVTRDKNQIFDQLQMRQAEVESIQSHLESLQNQNTEVQYQLREAQDRIALLTCDLQEAQREQETRLHQATVPHEEVARLLSSTELKYESKLTEVMNQVRQMRQMETERSEGEAYWRRKLGEKAREVDNMKSSLDAGAKSREALENLVNQLREESTELREEIRSGQQKLTELESAEDRINEIENSAREQEVELTSKIRTLEQQIEEATTRETQQRVSNKTLREELRKVQSSIALLERQRNPGIGYWSQRVDDAVPAQSRQSMQSESGSRTGSPTPTAKRNDEDINVEYLRNVILQFLEHKEMRPNLVRVISTLLRFTPQETRRLMAKV